MNKKQFSNRLQFETSPYLLQHAGNPVDWYPWGDEALSKAREENKLIIVSVGYAACHWCHVMEHQSFEDAEVASLMNKYFVCIKVDREERPDIDQVYMNAVQLISGGGGWPLNCFALPDGAPFYGGTYFPKDSWMQVLNSLVQYWQTDKEKLIEHALQLKKGMMGSDIIFGKTDDRTIEKNHLEEIISSWKNNFDTQFGGENRAPKFPMPNNYEFLLTYAHFSHDPSVADFIKLTLDKMCEGGIYDHVGGGFARYSVDRFWKVPHFEKMLYDNAQLVSLYSKAYKVFKKEKYKNVVEETIDFIAREMTYSEGAFYSSFDADSEGEEGKFYVWHYDEINTILGKNAGLYTDYYSVIPGGNWENGKNILHIAQSPEAISGKHNVNQKELDRIIDESNQLLFKQRLKRVPPALDDKILTSWNALMTIGLLDAYEAFGNKMYLSLAKRNIKFLLENNLKNDGSLFRNFKNGKSTINAFLDDYALLANALIKLYGISGEMEWLESSEKLVGYAIQHFLDENSGMFYYTSDLDAPLAVRKMELSDNVIPASNSIMAKNLYLLSIYQGNNDYKKMTGQMLANVKTDMLKYTRYYSNWAELATWFVYPFYEIIIIGSHAKERIEELLRQYHPNCAIAYSEDSSENLLFKNRFVEGKTLIYVCQDNTCKRPVETVEGTSDLLM